MDDKEHAKAEWLRTDATCVVCREDVLYISHETGLRPLLSLLETRPALLRGAAVADKIVGKAAALLLVYGGAAAVHAGLMSDPARDVLTRAGITVTYDRRVLAVKNRDGTALCPMEQRVLTVQDPAQAYALLINKGI